MNLFINNNFINTHGQLVDVQQLLRQIADVDDVIESEILAILSSKMDFPGDFDEDLHNGDLDFVVLSEGTVYVNGEALQVVFEDLLPGDYTMVVEAIARQIDNASGSTLRLDHNGVPVEEQLALPEVAPEPFPGDQAEAEVCQSDLATVDPASSLGMLKFNGHQILTALTPLEGRLVFAVDSLYRAIYGHSHEQDYLCNLVVANREVLRPSDVHYSFGRLYLSIDALTKLHQHLAYHVEWLSMVATVVNTYANNPYEDVNFNLLGHQVG